MRTNNEKTIKYYTNATAVEITNVDIKLKVDYKVNNERESLCDIIFSPEQAKLTSMMLNNAIEEYERTIRKIDLFDVKIKKSKGENTDGGEKNI